MIFLLTSCSVDESVPSSTLAAETAPKTATLKSSASSAETVAEFGAAENAGLRADFKSP